MYPFADSILYIRHPDSPRPADLLWPPFGSPQSPPASACFSSLSAHLAYPESSQRTFISDPSLSNACPMSDAVLYPKSFHLDDPSMYSAASSQSVSYSFHSFHEPTTLSPSTARDVTSPMEDMFQVFSADSSNSSTLLPRPADMIPATFTFQLGPESLEQIDDPEARSVIHPADDDSESWEGRVAERMVESPFESNRLPSPESFNDQVSKKIQAKQFSSKLVPSANTKRSKMHQCHLCLKWFPRPSGLATHMNSHSGLRPFSCPLPTCNKTFAVRSNAKRHLRTHGIIPDPESSHKSNKYTVGFDIPLVSEVHETSEHPPRLRWVPQSLISRMDVDWSRSTDSESDDDTCPILPVPLHPSVSPVSWDSTYDGTTMCNEAATQPYHPRHWRGLPGPALRQLVS